MTAKRNIQIIYKEIPDGLPDPSRTFEIRKGNIIPEDVILKSEELLLRTLFISVDPYMRALMREPSIEIDFPALKIGESMLGYALSEVVKSNNPGFNVGDVVEGFTNWEEYSIISPSQTISTLNKIPNAKDSTVPISYFLGVLGVPGFAAYYGLHKICEPLTPGQTLYVSNAAGAVGQMVGQYGKILGLRVVGSAGDDEKVDYLLKDLGLDAAFNYKKHKDFNTILKVTCPNGIDIYFDCVGGKMLDAVLKNCNVNARIALCGMISQYNRFFEQKPLYNMGSAILKSIRLEGFLIGKATTEFIQTFTKFIKEGKLKCQEVILNGIETLPEAYVGHFQGNHFGKVLVKVAEL